MKLETLKAYRNEIIAIAESCHAPNIRVFGSVARGESTVSSDVDFLIDVVPEQANSFVAYTDQMSQEANDLLVGVEIDEDETLGVAPGTRVVRED
jgi:uncharacterized protein